MDEEALAVRPLCVLLRKGVQPLPGREIFDFRARGGGKAVENRLIDVQDLRRFGNRQHRKAAVHRSLLQKLRQKGIQLLIGEIVAVVYQNTVVRQGQNGLRIGNEHIRQFGRTGVIVSGGKYALVNGVGVANTVHPHTNPLLLSHSTVELLHQHVQRRGHFASVDMPDRHGGRIRFLFSAGSETARKDQEQRKYQQQISSFLHGYASSLERNGDLIFRLF